MSGRLNLARTLRSKTFDEIIGQELSVRLVKNSLYRDQLFPAYLLAGQRGCGKTSLGRVFAAAINCANIKEFQKQPRNVQVPCLRCASCQAMYTGKHPDFFEIDAASHTGVDHVRSLIESASFMPGLGRKKIYLIDEAHMLSKAAFNAFLKILEEPPPTVIFMLATTDPHKIIETVRSRCFQLYLDPVPPTILADYLKTVCEKEEITYTQEALYALAQEAEGSVRDALTRLEQINLAFGAVNLTDLVHMRGEIGDETLLEVLYLALVGSHSTLLQYLKQHEFKQYNALLVWKKGVEFLRQLIGLHYGVTDSFYARYEDAMKCIIELVPAQVLIERLERWYRLEPLFAKSKAQHTLIEMLLLRMQYKNASDALVPGDRAEGFSKENLSEVSKSALKERVPSKGTPLGQKNLAASTIETQPLQKNDGVRTSLAEEGDELEKSLTKSSLPEKETPSNTQSASPATDPSTSQHPEWGQLLELIKAADDPLVYSIFKQARLDSFDQGGVHLAFSKEVTFFQELIEQTRLVWQPLLEKVFGTISLKTLFSDEKPSIPVLQNARVTNTSAHSNSPEFARQRPEGQRPGGQRPEGQRQGGSTPNAVRGRSWTAKSARVIAEKKIRVDVRDRSVWPKVHDVLQHFPGIVYEV